MPFPSLRLRGTGGVCSGSNATESEGSAMSGSIEVFTDQNWQQEVMESSTPVLVDFVMTMAGGLNERKKT